MPHPFTRDACSDRVKEGLDGSTVYLRTLAQGP